MIKKYIKIQILSIFTNHVDDLNISEIDYCVRCLGLRANRGFLKKNIIY